jgi:hypothetical protein
MPLGGALGIALVSCLLSAAAATGDTQARSLELNAIKLQFTSFRCLNGSCSLALVTDAGKATSNLGTGAGSTEGTLNIDFSPGGSCNIVDETRTFSFAEGTVLVHSHHEDCATHGLRVDTTFDVTDGTGAFQGATGSGREFSAAAQPGFEYIGTISF